MTRQESENLVPEIGAGAGERFSVTLLGRKVLKHPWTGPCLQSFRRISPAGVMVLSDGTLEEPEIEDYLGNFGVSGNPVANQEEIVAEALAPYPALADIRRRDFSWRKIIDAPLIGSADLFMDTDVYIRRACVRPHPAAREIVYLRDDVPAYRGGWTAVFQEPMVLSCNSGVVMFSSDAIDLDFLDHCARRYFLGLRYPWWSEQMAWSLMAARLPRRSFFDGRDARSVNGTGTRSDADMSRNVSRLISRRKYIQSQEELQQLSGSAAVVHMPGNTKPFFEALLPGDDDSRQSLRVVPDHPVNGWLKAALAARMLARGASDAFRR